MDKNYFPRFLSETFWWEEGDWWLKPGVDWNEPRWYKKQLSRILEWDIGMTWRWWVNDSNRKLIEVNPVESEVLIVDWMIETEWLEWLDDWVIDDSNRELVEVNPVEGEILIVHWMQSASNHSGFHLLMQKLIIKVRINFLLQKSTLCCFSGRSCSFTYGSLRKMIKLVFYQDFAYLQNWD